MIQEIQKQSGATISIKEEGNIGKIEIFAPDQPALENARQYIKRITAVPVVGEKYEGQVISIMSFGAFVEILPGKEGLLHVSEIAWERVEKTEEVFKPGDMVTVLVKQIDPKTGKLTLSRKALLPKPTTRPVDA